MKVSTFASFAIYLAVAVAAPAGLAKRPLNAGDLDGSGLSNGGLPGGDITSPATNVLGNGGVGGVGGGAGGGLPGGDIVTSATNLLGGGTHYLGGGSGGGATGGVPGNTDIGITDNGNPIVSGSNGVTSFTSGIFDNGPVFDLTSIFSGLGVGGNAPGGSGSGSVPSGGSGSVPSGGSGSVPSDGSGSFPSDGSGSVPSGGSGSVPSGGSGSVPSDGSGSVPSDGSGSVPSGGSGSVPSGGSGYVSGGNFDAASIYSIISGSRQGFLAFRKAMDLISEKACNFAMITNEASQFADFWRFIPYQSTQQLFAAWDKLDSVGHVRGVTPSEYKDTKDRVELARSVVAFIYTGTSEGVQPGEFKSTVSYLRCRQLAETEGINFVGVDPKEPQPVNHPVIDVDPLATNNTDIVNATATTYD
ncbi:hypothetical protein AA313_de0201227 [Arthrobotrys entomopaga]|nr:hypothetical protein AA313_de0201227 [Arthrobotrys entomopaga]